MSSFDSQSLRLANCARDNNIYRNICQQMKTSIGNDDGTAQLTCNFFYNSNYACISIATTQKLSNTLFLEPCAQEYLTLAVLLNGNATFFQGSHEFLLNTDHARLISLQRISKIEISLNAGAKLLLIKIPASGQHILSRANKPLNSHAALPISQEMQSSTQSIFGREEDPFILEALVLNRAFTIALLHLRKLVRSTNIEAPIPQEEQLKIRKAKNILQQNYINPPTLANLARTVGINRNKLSKGFKELFGMTVSTYSQHYRMELARKLLNDSAHNIAVIADTVGYEHPGNFTVAYKRKYGQLPKAARRTAEG